LIAKFNFTKRKGFIMGWQDTVGGLVDQVSGSKEGEAEKTDGGLLGMAGSLMGSLGGDKQQMLSQLTDKLGASGVDVNSLLEKLGINPDEATDEDFEKLAAQAQGDEGISSEATSVVEGEAPAEETAN
jgi:hypothetical protein